MACWLDSSKTIGVDTSHVMFNIDCRVSLTSNGLVVFCLHSLQMPQYTTEWAIPYAKSQACLLELRAWLEKEQQDPYGARPHFPIEIRFTSADDIWLSPSNGQETCWIGIIQYKWDTFSALYFSFAD